MVDVKITYETLFDLLRREKGRNELQALDSSFYSDVVIYLKDKQKTLSGQDPKSSLYSRGEQEKIRIQIKNIKKILTELYELREKKILNLAINKVKTGSDLIDTSNLLVEEKSFFHDACVFLDKHRKDVLEQVLIMDFVSSETTPSSTTSTLADDSLKETPSVNSSDSVQSESDVVKVRILCDLPKFVGTDRNIYGPFSKDDETDLPSNIASLLVKKGRATNT